MRKVLKNVIVLNTIIQSIVIIPIFSAAQNGNNKKNIHFQTNQSSSANSYNISGINIISNLPDSEFVGTAPSQYSDVRTNLVFESGVRTTLQSLINEKYSNTFKQNGSLLQWAINDLSVGSDSTTDGIINHTKLSIDIYKSDSNSLLIGKYDTLIISTDSNADFGLSIAVALNGAYEKSGTILNTSVTNTISSSVQKKEVVKLQNMAAKILTDTSYKTGVFVSFNEFKNDAPSITQFFTSFDTASHNILINQLDKDDEMQLVQNVWGIASNNELYVYVDGQLYPIEKNGTGFYLSKYIDFTKRTNQAVYWRNKIGNFQGDTNPFNDNHVYRVPLSGSSSIKTEALRIDMQTGKLTY
ncbi:hypothetical protein A9P82_12985 [Arachidicoccus ginsenosidimutans]|uniref:hypothetical protein n=1 Tax=Arachidicoccus sp. BS20 TaxID=1850526 RepID=UPI0007F12D78|nr:hypothetical protein [Arachidicoccus sp. BS20]ANI90117.1 hypothetical protein A9P82_12985 [Arachidicoccus sp. BS20]